MSTKKSSSQIAHNFKSAEKSAAKRVYQDQTEDKLVYMDNKSASSKYSKASRARTAKKRPKLVSFRELRENQRIQENAHMGPGATEHQKPFGSGLNKVNFGSKYVFKADRNPAPGQYEDVKEKVLTRKYEAFIAVRKGRDMPKELPPDAGQYEPHTKFGKTPQKMTMGGKYKWKADSNPPPGYYNVEDSTSFVKPKAKNFSMSKQQRTQWKAESGPDAGTYNAATKFGDKPQKMTLGGKYKWKADTNPPPGYYDADVSTVKPKSRGAIIRADQALVREKEQNPDAGQYNPHKKFGSVSQSMTLGGKYKWKPDANPPPGYYEPDHKLVTSSSPSTKISRGKRTNFTDSLGGNPGVGQYDGHIKPFGSGLHQRMTLGGKYVWKADDNPPPGSYEADVAAIKIRQKSPSVLIKEDRRPPRTEERMPAPGQYDAHLKPFGSTPQLMTLGSKYKWKPNDNPPPGLYDADVSLDKVKSSSPSARLHRPLIPEHQRRVPEPTPTAYDGHLTAFGADNKNRMTWGGKYEFKVNDVPPPGYYDPEKAASVVLARTPSAVIHEETMVDPEAAPVQVLTRPRTSPMRGSFNQRSINQYSNQYISSHVRGERESQRQYREVPMPSTTEQILRQNEQPEVVHVQSETRMQDAGDVVDYRQGSTIQNEEVVRQSTQVQSQQNYEYTTETRTFVTKVTKVERNEQYEERDE